MNSTTESNSRENTNEGEVEFTEDLAQLLDEHDYDLPSVGDIRQAIIVAISDQGIIVDLSLKRDGLVQPSDLDELDPEERSGLKINDEIPVYILETNQPDRLLVSIQKAKLNRDWISAQEMMDSGDILEAPIIGYNRGGVIVPFGKLRGFVPASHLTELRRGMDDGQRQQVMSKMLEEILPLKVIEVNRRRKRLVLSQRDAQKEWQESRKLELLDNLNEGAVIRGRVSGLRSFGAFVDLGGADGLIHISELAWHRVNHPREVVKVGESLDVYVLALDKEEQRIALSRKRLLENPWSTAEQRYLVGQLVEGKVTRIVAYGAFVEIEPGVEGLLHISQLSRETVAEPQDLIKEGDIHLLRIISLDSEKQRVGLSLKNVSTSEQIEWMSSREFETAKVEGTDISSVTEGVLSAEEALQSESSARVLVTIDKEAAVVVRLELKEEEE
ncbi:MAG TPA: S1 RNA-binding domain-containing protein [Patescibacteria group bacterium]|nr:S1 RNA-binding domain-containing protein [Patescibacteria group bacterium]